MALILKCASSTWYMWKYTYIRRQISILSHLSQKLRARRIFQNLPILPCKTCTCFTFSLFKNRKTKCAWSTSYMLFIDDVGSYVFNFSFINWFLGGAHRTFREIDVSWAPNTNFFFNAIFKKTKFNYYLSNTEPSELNHKCQWTCFFINSTTHQQSPTPDVSDVD